MQSGQVDESRARRPGRPRDPDVEDKVFDAAMGVYAQHGWTGFTFEAVAREAGIGRPALYRRWGCRGELLAQTVQSRWLFMEPVDTGNLHDDLLSLARATLSHMLGPYGQTVTHILLDVPRYPEVAASTAAYRESRSRTARQLVRRAIDRGELPRGTSPSLVIDMLIGSCIIHVGAGAPDHRTQIVTGADNYARGLVTAVLRGLEASRS